MTTETNVKPSETEERGAERTRAGLWFRPSVDIVEKTDELLLVADLPGAKPDAIDIDFEDGVLSISGKVEPRYDEKMSFLLYEYGVGNFHRSFRASEQVDSGRIRAEFNAGVLTVHLPKAEAAKPRKIHVQGAG
jgi:HSP20 family molecular chaperone IbpA